MVKLPGDESKLLYSNYEGCFDVPVPNWVQSSIPKEDILSLLYDSFNKEKPLPDRMEDFEGKIESFFNYDTGQLKGRVNYKKGKFDGQSETFYENGQLKQKGTYKEGNLNGLCEIYYVNGQIQLRIHFKDGVKEGVSENYYVNGQLQLRIHLKNGKLDGLSEYFDEEGNLTNTEEYKKDVLISP